MLFSETPNYLRGYAYTYYYFQTVCFLLLCIFIFILLRNSLFFLTVFVLVLSHLPPQALYGRFLEVMLLC